MDLTNSPLSQTNIYRKTPLSNSANSNDNPSGIKKGLTRYGDAEFSLFMRKAFIKAMGFSDSALDRPIIGITNTYSDFNPCHGNVPQMIEAAKRGVMQAGGKPQEGQ